MTRTRTWISAALLGIAATTAAVTAAAGAAVAGPTQAQAAPATVPVAVAADPAAAPAPVEGAPPAKTLPHDTRLQPNFYYCGPTATRNALSVFGVNESMDRLAADMGTTEDGTNSSKEITAALNKRLGADRYRTVEIPHKKASPAEIATLKSDVVTNVSEGDPIVANVAGTVTDTDGQVHSYEGGHYLAVVGYEANGAVVTIADSADPVGSPDYQLPTSDLANWIATRGYSA